MKKSKKIILGSVLVGVVSAVASLFVHKRKKKKNNSTRFSLRDK